jgi:protein-S-isoprenylcysteine O-methyltransferase Ste14
MSMDPGTVRRVWLPLVIGSVAFAIIFKASPSPYALARYTGLTLAVIGLSGIIIARRTLGQSFSWAPKARSLVTTGIYSRIRNPIYACGGICLIGTALMVWRLYFLVVLLALLPIQIVRARREAAVLESNFGEEYRQYRQRTWF